MIAQNDGSGSSFAYTGQRIVPHLGLYYYKARFYSPYLGRFLQTDPIGVVDDMNMYAYVGNDPINGIDPSGLLLEKTQAAANQAWSMVRNIQVNDVMRAVVPGAGAMQDAEDNWARGNYGAAGLDTVRAFLEAGLGVFTFGEGTAALQASRSAAQAGRAAVSAARGAGVADDAFTHGFRYADRVRTRSLQDPSSHNFPYTFDDGILAATPIPRANGYNIYQTPGSMGGKQGVFEIGVTKDGVVDHRFFRPTR
jgi:RHS repeat-associated protein